MGVTSRTRVGRIEGPMGFWQVLWVSRQRFSQVVASVRLLMLPVLERPGVGSMSPTASARDPVVNDLVLPCPHRLLAIYYEYFI